MKNLFLIWFVFFLITWGAYMATQFVLLLVREQDFDVLEKCLLGVFFAFLMLSVYMANSYSALSRFRYLESNSTEKPPFKVPCSSVIDLPQGFDFNRLKVEIVEKWLITFSDDAKQVLKFRTRISFFSSTYGVAAWLKYDCNVGKIYIRCFPMIGMQDDKLALKMQKEIDIFLKNIATM